MSRIYNAKTVNTINVVTSPSPPLVNTNTATSTTTSTTSNNNNNNVNSNNLTKLYVFNGSNNSKENSSSSIASSSTSSSQSSSSSHSPNYYTLNNNNKSPSASNGSHFFWRFCLLKCQRKFLRIFSTNQCSIFFKTLSKYIIINQNFNQFLARLFYLRASSLSLSHSLIYMHIQLHSN